MPTPGVSTGLVYHWLLNGDATDETGTHDLTEYGGITYAADVPSVLSGVATQSVDLDGSADYLATTINVTFRSMACWFKYDTLATNFRVFNWQTNNLSPLFRTSGVLDMVYKDNGNSLSFMASKSGLTSGDWVHIAWSGSSSANVVYFNGTAHDSTADGFTTVSSVLQIGRYLTGVDHLDGHISDFRLYSTSLTASDVTTIYNGDWGAAPATPTRRTLQLETRLNTRLRTHL